MLEHVGYSQAPGPGTSFSGVTGNGAPNAHYYLNSNKATSQQHNATTNHHHHHQHHQRLNGTGNNNNTSGVNPGINASASASTTTSTTNTNSTTSHANGISHKGSAGNSAGGGSITVTVTATTTTTTTATATTTTTNANANAHTNTHITGAASSVHHHHTPNSGAAKIKTKRTKRAFLPHSTSASRAASERTPSASSSPINRKHNFISPKTTFHQEKPSVKLQPEGGNWSSPIKRSVSCASPSLTSAGRSASPSLREQQRSFSNIHNTPHANGITKSTSLPTGANQFSDPTHTFGNHDQRAPDMLLAAVAPGELRKDGSFNTAPRAQNGHVNIRPKINGFHHEFSHSPSPALLRPDSGVVVKPKAQKTSSTPTSTAAKPRPAKSTGLHKENRTTPTVVEAIEIRSHSTTPESQSGGRPIFQQESTPNVAPPFAPHLDLENGTPNGTLGKRQHPDSSVSAKGPDTTLKSLGRFTHTVIKKYKVNGVPHTAALVTSHPRLIPPTGYSLHAQSPIVIVDDDDDDDGSSASPKTTFNRDDEANSASPVFMANGEDSFRSASSVVMVNGDRYPGSASPVVMMDVDDGVGSASPVIMVNGRNDSGSATPVTMANGDKMGAADPIVTTNGNKKIRPTTPPPIPMNGVPGYPPPVPLNGVPGFPPPRLRWRPKRVEKAPFDSDAFDALIYAQPGAQSPPAGVCASKHSRRGSDMSQLEDRLYLHRNPAIQGMHERSDEWYRKKLASRPPGGRKEWFGKVRERQRWLKSQQDKLSRPSDNALRDGISKKKDPEPWAHQRSLDFGDVPEDDLPSYVKENPAWLKFCSRLRDARTRMDTMDSGLQRQERAKRKAEVDEKSLTRKQIAQRQLASKFQRQTEEFYNAMKQA